MSVNLQLSELYNQWWDRRKTLLIMRLSISQWNWQETKAQQLFKTQATSNLVSRLQEQGARSPNPLSLRQSRLPSPNVCSLSGQRQISKKPVFLRRGSYPKSKTKPQVKSLWRVTTSWSNTCRAWSNIFRNYGKNNSLKRYRGHA